MVVVGITVGVVYYLTTSRYLPWGDGAEFYLAAKNLGIPHPSGYPLFLILARVFLSFAPTPFTLNLLSSGFTIATAILLSLILYHFTSDSIISSALAIFFAFGRVVWLQSIVGEVYSLNMLLLTLLFITLIKSDHPLPIFLYLTGLALTNHLTSLFYIIPAGIYLLSQRSTRAEYLPFLLIPLFLYLYFPIRSRADPIPDTFNPEGLSGLLQLISGRIFHYRTFFFDLNYLIQSFWGFLKAVWWQFLIISPFGIYGLMRIEKRFRGLISFMISIPFCYILFYNIPDKDGYYLPIFLLWLILIGIGMASLLPSSYRKLLILLPVAGFILNFRHCDLSHDSSLEDLTQSIFKTLPDSSIFFSDDFFLYYSMIEKGRDGNIALVLDFYLRFRWYLDQLSAKITIPEEVRPLLRRCDQELRSADRIEYGEISKQYCNLIKREIVTANLKKRPIFTFIYQDGNWPKRWLDLYLETRGLYYRLLREPPQLSDFPLPLPSSNRYRLDYFTNEDARTVVKKFAAAYNRRGIIRTQMGDLKRAVEDFQRSLGYDPKYYQVMGNLGLAYLFQGDTVNCCRWLRRYLESGYEDDKTPLIRGVYKEICR